jgi:hypothetical protein
MNPAGEEPTATALGFLTTRIATMPKVQIDAAGMERKLVLHAKRRVEFVPRPICAFSEVPLAIIRAVVMQHL